MFPGCRGMTSYPYQSNQVPSIQYFQPNWDGMLSQAKDNPTGPVMHGPWPNYYGYNAPMQCPNCCNHSHYPGPSYFSLHCQHIPSPPAHFYGGYPAYPHPCQVSYAPPPNYAMDLPRYEYDKSVPGKFHCCGCPNHPCHLNQDKNNIKIEEHEPDVETRKCQSLDPSRDNNFSYPVLWIPPGYMMNKEKPKSVDLEADGKQISPYLFKPQRLQQKPTETDSDEHQYSPYAKPWHLERPSVSGATNHQESLPAEKTPESVHSVEKDPNLRHGWFPLDIDSLRELMEGGVGRKTHGHEKKVADEKTEDVANKDQSQQSPYNIYWLPLDGQGNNEGKTEGKVHSEEKSTTAREKSTHFDNELEKGSLARGDYSSGNQAAGSNVKTIPVKQADESVPNPLNRSKEVKKDGPHVNDAYRNEKGECARNGSNAQSSASVKKSKLPPICLRVDPPKKKNGNGSSRSPSPPSNKKVQSQNDSMTSDRSAALPPTRKEVKVVYQDEKPSEDKVKPMHVDPDEKKGIVEDEATLGKEKTVSDVGGKAGVATRGDNKEKQTQDSIGEKVSESQEANKCKSKTLSESEAAIIIQSGFRGYEVRRWQPLMKLRQIAKVRGEVCEVRKHIEDLSSGAVCFTDKEKTAVGEIIMNLLLKLDTIQGLLPSVRDVRKCVAKELIVLQEKLDSITGQKVAPSTEKTHSSMKKCPETLSGGEGLEDDIETTDEWPKDSNQVDGTAGSSGTVNVFFSTESNQVEGSKDDMEIAHEFSSKDSTPVKGSEDNAAIELSSKDFIQVKDHEKDAESANKSSKDSSQDENSHSAKEVSMLDEGSRDANLNVKAFEEELTPGMNAPASYPQESLKQSKESPGEPKHVESVVVQDDMTFGNEENAKELLAELPKDDVDYDEVVKTEPVKVEPIPRMLCNDSDDSPTVSEHIESDAVQNDIFGNEQEAENLLAELPREVVDFGEIDKETPKMEHEAPHNDAGSICSHEAVEYESPGDKDLEVEADLLSELPQELPEKVMEEATSKVSGSGMWKQSPEMEQSTKVESCNCNDQDMTIDIDIPILEQDVDGIQDKVDEAVSAVENDFSVNKPNSVHDEETNIKNPVVSLQTMNARSAGNKYARELQLEHQDITRENNQDISVGLEVERFKDEDERSNQSTETSLGSIVGSQHEEEINKKIIEENDRLKQMLEKLIAYGKEQQQVISSLSRKVRDLEETLARKKKIESKPTKRSRVKVSRSLCGKSANGFSSERSMSVAS